MLQHSREASWKPRRVVVLGVGGFVGGAIAADLQRNGIPVVGLARKDVDLLDNTAAAKLAEIFRADDALVAVSAVAPCKNLQMFQDNIQMMRAIGDALTLRPVDHVVYISSDAVYADSMSPLSETSCAEPASLHGAMHLAREVMLRHAVGQTPLAILRPTLIYGMRDPHNGYGPNQFNRKAARGEDIVLFGEGEERRDHVLVDDVAAIAARVLTRRSSGVLNVATGTVTSFRDVAELIAGAFKPAPAVKGSPRKGPVPHNGYRAFDVSACRAAFPDFELTPLSQGLKHLPRS